MESLIHFVEHFTHNKDDVPISFVPSKRRTRPVLFMVMIQEKGSRMGVRWYRVFFEDLNPDGSPVKTLFISIRNHRNTKTRTKEEGQVRGRQTRLRVL